MKTVLYPGTFDPLTNGHLSLIRRGCKIFDRVIVAVADSTPKKPLFTHEERMALAREALRHERKAVVEGFSGLTVDYAVRSGACALLRGLRAVSDFEYELQLALMNRRLQRQIETVFMMTDYQWLYISSTIVKAASSQGGDVKGLVPENVRQALQEKFAQGKVRMSTPCLLPPHDGFSIA